MVTDIETRDYAARRRAMLTTMLARLTASVDLGVTMPRATDGRGHLLDIEHALLTKQDAGRFHCDDAFQDDGSMGEPMIAAVAETARRLSRREAVTCGAARPGGPRYGDSDTYAHPLVANMLVRGSGDAVDRQQDMAVTRGVVMTGVDGTLRSDAERTILELKTGLPESVAANCVDRALSDVIDVPACGMTHVDQAVAALRIAYVETIDDGIRVVIANADWIECGDPANTTRIGGVAPYGADNLHHHLDRKGER